MSIRYRLLLLVSALVLISATVLVYLASAYLDTRQRLREADVVLDELVRAAGTSAAIARLRLLVLYRQSTGAGAPGEVEELALGCERAFDAWSAASDLAIQAGIGDEADDLAQIKVLAQDFQTELERLRTALDAKAAPDPAVFDQLLDSGVRVLFVDDLGEMSTAFDGILLSMGTTPWIARIGPGQLATARATLAEIRAAHLVRDRLQRQASRIALLLADASPEIDREIISTTVSLNETMGAWLRATEAYVEVSGEPAPPHYEKFVVANRMLQEHVNLLLEDERHGRIDDARTRAAETWMPALQNELLPILEESLNSEVAELRNMLLELSSSTASAGAGGIAVICAVLLATVAGAFHTVRSMLRSLDQLRAGTERVGAGDFAHRLNLGAADELGALGAKFDAMAEKLQEQVRQRQALEAELLRNERLATLGQVIATVSHEIRNPLGTIQTSIYALRKRLGDQSDAVSSSLDRADRSIVRCNRIIGELLDYTRTRAPNRVETPLDSWLAQVLDDFNFPTGVAVSCSLSSGATLPIDRNHIQGCIVNLLSNACQSMMERQDGRTPCILRIESEDTGSRVEVRVNDTGPGIAPEILDKIFEPMFSTRTFGVGLGLPIVKKTMEQHGGNVEIVSELNRGTTATLWFPASVLEKT
ncbi:MAG: HAMP domain-containing protein [Candidatus Hydrogenedentes bacterium]|nr:HAMP domain-containing protein [Candidatus Hydrogenedentota bacterium]